MRLKPHADMPSLLKQANDPFVMLVSSVSVRPVSLGWGPAVATIFGATNRGFPVGYLDQANPLLPFSKSN